jgi:AraC family ethanolamine operon transcriptional activator
LRDALNEVHGVSPQRYLLLRRIHEAHRALREGDRAGSVTDVALRFSFWELGRFAGQYRAEFGELPSATLRGHRGGVAPVR